MKRCPICNGFHDLEDTDYCPMCEPDVGSRTNSGLQPSAEKHDGRYSILPDACRGDEAREIWRGMAARLFPDADEKEADAAADLAMDFCVTWSDLATATNQLAYSCAQERDPLKAVRALMAMGCVVSMHTSMWLLDDMDEDDPKECENCYSKFREEGRLCPDCQCVEDTGFHIWD